MPATEWKHESVDLIFHNVVTIIHPDTFNDLSPFSGISRMLQRTSNSARPARRSPAWNGNNARALGSDRSRVPRTRLPGPARAPAEAHVTQARRRREQAGAPVGSAAPRRRPRTAPSRAPPAPSRSQNGGEGDLEQSRSLSH